MEDEAQRAADAVLRDNQTEVKVAVLKGHVQKLVPFIQHAQQKGCYNLEQASQIYAILMAIKQT